MMQVQQELDTIKAKIARLDELAEIIDDPNIYNMFAASDEQQEEYDNLKAQGLLERRAELEKTLLENATCKQLQRELVQKIIFRYFPPHTIDDFHPNQDGFMEASSSDLPAILQLKNVYNILQNLHLLTEDPNTSYKQKVEQAFALRENFKNALRELDISFIDAFFSTRDESQSGDERSVQAKIMAIMNAVSSQLGHINVDNAELLITEAYRMNKVIGLTSADDPEQAAAVSSDEASASDTPVDVNPLQLAENIDAEIEALAASATAAEAADVISEEDEEFFSFSEESEEQFFDADDGTQAEAEAKQAEDAKAKAKQARNDKIVQVLQYAKNRMEIKTAGQNDGAAIAALKKTVGLSAEYMDTYKVENKNLWLLEVFKIFYREHRSLYKSIASHDENSFAAAIQSGDNKLFKEIEDQARLLRQLHCALASTEANFGLRPGALTVMLKPYAEFVENLAELVDFDLSEDDRYNYRNATFKHLLQDWQLLDARHRARLEHLNDLQTAKQQLTEIDISNPAHRQVLIDIGKKLPLSDSERADFNRQVNLAFDTYEQNKDAGMMYSIAQNLGAFTLSILPLSSETTSKMTGHAGMVMSDVMNIARNKLPRVIEAAEEQVAETKVKHDHYLYVFNLHHREDIRFELAKYEPYRAMLDAFEADHTSILTDPANEELIKSLLKYIDISDLNEEEIIAEVHKAFEQNAINPSVLIVLERAQEKIDALETELTHRDHYPAEVVPDTSLDGKALDQNRLTQDARVRLQIDAGKHYLKGLRKLMLLNVHQRFIPEVVQSIPQQVSDQRLERDAQDLSSVQAMKCIHNIMLGAENLLDEVYIPPKLTIDEDVIPFGIDCRAQWNAIKELAEDTNHAYRIYQKVNQLKADINELKSAYPPEYVEMLLKESELDSANLEQVTQMLSKYGISLDFKTEDPNAAQTTKPAKPVAQQVFETYETGASYLKSAADFAHAAVQEYRKVAEKLDDESSDNDLIKAAMGSAREAIEGYKTDPNVDPATVVMFEKLVTFGEMFQKHGGSWRLDKQAFSALTAIGALYPKEEEIEAIRALRQSNGEQTFAVVETQTGQQMTAEPTKDWSKKPGLSTLLHDDNLANAVRLLYGKIPMAYALSYKLAVDNGLKLDQTVDVVATMDHFIRNVAQSCDVQLTDDPHTIDYRDFSDVVEIQKLEKAIARREQRLARLEELSKIKHPNESVTLGLKEELEIEYRQLKVAEPTIKAELSMARLRHEGLKNKRTAPEQLQAKLYDRRIDELKGEVKALRTQLAEVDAELQALEGQIVFVEEIQTFVNPNEARYDELNALRPTLLAKCEYLEKNLKQRVARRDEVLEHIHQSHLQHARVYAEHDARRVLRTELEYTRFALVHALSEVERLSHGGNPITGSPSNKADVWMELVNHLMVHKADLEDKLRRPLSEKEEQEVHRKIAELKETIRETRFQLTKPYDADVKKQLQAAIEEAEAQIVKQQMRLIKPLSDQEIVDLNSQKELKTRVILDKWAKGELKPSTEKFEKPKLQSFHVADLFNFIKDILWFYVLRVRGPEKTNVQRLNKHRNPFNFFTGKQTRSGRIADTLLERTPSQMASAETGKFALDAAEPTKQLPASEAGAAQEASPNPDATSDEDELKPNGDTPSPH